MWPFIYRVQSRTAARKELLDQATAPNECEKLYEESLWCLYTLQDDLQSENPFMEEDRATIATCEAYLCLSCVVLEADDLTRDHTDETPPRSMPCPDGHER
jgi:hypothetical protein